ncbi:hypothetical protein C4D60_Mb07t24090 [Musa balbisiana]|uniref:Uncharacterized protein n=1 Tax=Musa balbisiana TaxID=52838 RepID=A0A4S8JJK6_MUSBA|nr:hypothetical protein C4D60_Mb07t24090 [Musa balbisiana]
MSLEPFNRLVKLAARAFYDDVTIKGENQPKTGRGDNRGMAVIVLDALSRNDKTKQNSRIINVLFKKCIIFYFLKYCFWLKFNELKL